MKFKIGDKVKIREDLAIGMGGNNAGIVGEMLKYKGKIATVIGYTSTGYYRLNIDNKDCGRWSWDDEVLEGTTDMKTADPVIEKLKVEREDYRLKIAEIGEKISEGNLEQYQIDLLSIRSRALKTVSVTYAAQLNALYREISTEGHAPEPKPKKYNVQVIGLPQNFYFRGVNGDLDQAGPLHNIEGDQQWTLEQIEKYGLQNCPRFEVTEQMRYGIYCGEGYWYGGHYVFQGEEYPALGAPINRAKTWKTFKGAEKHMKKMLKDESYFFDEYGVNTKNVIVKKIEGELNG